MNVRSKEAWRGFQVVAIGFSAEEAMDASAEYWGEVKSLRPFWTSTRQDWVSEVAELAACAMAFEAFAEGGWDAAKAVFERDHIVDYPV